MLELQCGTGCWVYSVGLPWTWSDSCSPPSSDNTPWHSTIIVKRISRDVLRTLSGKTYTLIGLMNMDESSSKRCSLEVRRLIMCNNVISHMEVGGGGSSRVLCVTLKLFFSFAEFPKWLLSKFVHGFPQDWKKHFERFLSETK